MQRRKFMAMLGVIGIAGLARPNGDVQTSNMNFFPALCMAVRDQARTQNASISDDEIACIRYGCDRIKPTTHVELAFIIAVSGKGLRLKGLVDEFARRRDGQPAQLDDHPILELKAWARPDTHRLPVFREQLICLVQELSGMNATQTTDYLDGVLKGRENRQMADIACSQYRETLSPDELKRIDSIISFFLPEALPYAYCSTLATRAESFAKGS